MDTYQPESQITLITLNMIEHNRLVKRAQEWDAEIKALASPVAVETPAKKGKK